MRLWLAGLLLRLPRLLWLSGLLLPLRSALKLLQRFEVTLQYRQRFLHVLLQFLILQAFHSLFVLSDRVFMGLDLQLHILLLELWTAGFLQLIHQLLILRLQALFNLNVLAAGDGLQLLVGLLMILHDHLRDALDFRIKLLLHRQL